MRRPQFRFRLLLSAAALYGLSVAAPSVVEARAILNATHLARTATSAEAPQAASELTAEYIAAAEPEALAEPKALAEPQTVAAAPEAAAPSTSADLTTATVAPAPSLGHLPAWVQVTVATASLYAADSAGDQVLTRIPRNTFLRLLGGGSSRLQVQAYDENGTPGQTGWITAEQVLPSAPGTDWLVAASATTLWSTSDGSAAAVRDISQFAPLQKLDGPLLDRIQVNVYASDFSKIVGTGWVDVAASGPALPPQVRVPGPANAALAKRAATGSYQQMAFLNAAAQAARQGAQLTGVPASVTVAQAILESDWGRSSLAQDANNYFGMKVMGTLGNDGLVWMPTSEYDDSGQLYETTSAFRAYKSLADSMLDHDRLLQLASRYSGAMKSTTNPQRFATLIAQEGYSTDPAYPDKLVALMDHYNLYQLDA